MKVSFMSCSPLHGRSQENPSILTDRKTVLDRLRLIDILSRIIPEHLYTIIIADGEFSSPAFLTYPSMDSTLCNESETFYFVQRNAT